MDLRTRLESHLGEPLEEVWDNMIYGCLPVGLLFGSLIAIAINGCK